MFVGYSLVSKHMQWKRLATFSLVFRKQTASLQLSNTKNLVLLCSMILWLLLMSLFNINGPQYIRNKWTTLSVQ